MFVHFQGDTVCLRGTGWWAYDLPCPNVRISHQEQVEPDSEYRKLYFALPQESVRFLEYPICVEDTYRE